MSSWQCLNFELSKQSWRVSDEVEGTRRLKRPLRVLLKRFSGVEQIAGGSTLVWKSRLGIIVTVSFLVVVEAVIAYGRSDELSVAVAFLVAGGEARTVIVVARPAWSLYDVVAVNSLTVIAVYSRGPGHTQQSQVESTRGSSNLRQRLCFYFAVLQCDAGLQTQW